MAGKCWNRQFFSYKKIVFQGQVGVFSFSAVFRLTILRTEHREISNTTAWCLDLVFFCKLPQGESECDVFVNPKGLSVHEKLY